MEIQIEPYIIAIGSVSGGGKTTLTKRLSATLNNATALYFGDYDFEGVPENIVEWVKNGSDHNIWNLTPMINDIEKLLSEHRPLEYILLDYPFSCLHKKMSLYIDFTIFIDTPLDIALVRRVLRDFSVSSGEEIRNNMKQYIDKARIAYMDMLNTIRPNSDCIIDGSMPLDSIVEIVLKEIKNNRRI